MNIKKASSISTITYEDCRAYIANEIFPKPQSTTNDQPEKVGLEIEMLPIVTDSREAPTRTARHDQTSAVISELARDHHWEILSAPTQDGKAEVLTLVRIQGGATLSFEPGGQMEYASAPSTKIGDMLAQIDDMQDLIGKALVRNKTQLIQMGMNPWETPIEIGLQIPKKRYVAMDRYLSNISPHGRRMMRQTCTVQVCLDFGGSHATMARRFAAAHLISPYATAIFAYSPVMDNRKTDLLSNRANIWQHMDPTRTGILDTTDILKQQSREACIDQYLAFALEAQVVFVENLGYHVPRQGTSFATWMKNGIEGQYPNMMILCPTFHFYFRR